MSKPCRIVFEFYESFPEAQQFLSKTDDDGKAHEKNQRMYLTFKIIKHKASLLNLAEELGNISKACKVIGRDECTYVAVTQECG